MSYVRPFSGGKTTKITVGASTARVLVGNRNGPTQVRICNLGTAPAWIKAGDVTVEATTSDIPIPGNGFTEVQTFSPGEDGTLYIAAIAAGATGDIHFTIGEGV